MVIIFHIHTARELGRCGEILKRYNIYTIMSRSRSTERQLVRMICHRLHMSTFSTILQSLEIRCCLGMTLMLTNYPFTNTKNCRKLKLMEASGRMSWSKCSLDDR